MEYTRARSVEDALALLAGAGARPLGGGTDLVGQIDHGLAAPETIVDLREAGLGEIAATADDGLAIGATVTLARLASDPLLAPYAAVASAAGQAASPLLRN
jgi:CO/xanthine dehydrogenase FAD-binding subunit